MTTNNKKFAVQETLTPSVTIDLPVARKEDGSLELKEFKIIFDWAAVCVVEEKTGRNMLSHAGWNNINARDLVVFLYAGLNACHPELDVNQVRRMITPDIASTVITTILKSWALNSPKSSQEDPESPNKVLQ